MRKSLLPLFLVPLLAPAVPAQRATGLAVMHRPIEFPDAWYVGNAPAMPLTADPAGLPLQARLTISFVSKKATLPPIKPDEPVHERAVEPLQWNVEVARDAQGRLLMQPGPPTPRELSLYSTIPEGQSRIFRVIDPVANCSFEWTETNLNRYGRGGGVAYVACLPHGATMPPNPPWDAVTEDEKKMQKAFGDAEQAFRLERIGSNTLEGFAVEVYRRLHDITDAQGRTRTIDLGERWYAPALKGLVKAVPGKIYEGDDPAYSGPEDNSGVPQMAFHISHISHDVLPREAFYPPDNFRIVRWADRGKP